MTEAKSKTPSQKVRQGICPLCDHRLDQHDKQGRCEVPSKSRQSICNCGHAEALGLVIQDFIDKKDEPKLSLRERIEKSLGVSGEQLYSANLSGNDSLLREALYAAESNATLLTAWTKRAMEAEAAINRQSDLEKKLAMAEVELADYRGTYDKCPDCGYIAQPTNEEDDCYRCSSQHFAFEVSKLRAAADTRGDDDDHQ